MLSPVSEGLFRLPVSLAAVLPAVLSWLLLPPDEEDPLACGAIWMASDLALAAGAVALPLAIVVG